jgi:hypothetical protein
VGARRGGQQGKATRKARPNLPDNIYHYANSYNSYYVNKMVLHLVCALLVYLYLDWVLYVVLLYR